MVVALDEIQGEVFRGELLRYGVSERLNRGSMEDQTKPSVKSPSSKYLIMVAGECASICARGCMVEGKNMRRDCVESHTHGMKEG